MSGEFKTYGKANVELKLPELNPIAKISVNLHVYTQDSNYDTVLGRDILKKLGMILDFQNETVIWEEQEVSMKPSNYTITQHFSISDPVSIQAETERMKKILSAKYKKADVREVADSANTLDTSKKEALYHLLKKYDDLFDGTLGQWTGTDYKIELREGAKPYHARPYSIPRAHEATFKMEVERIVRTGVLRKINHSEWADPTFIIPKKDKSVRFISNFRKLNERIKRKQYPITKISDLLLKLEGF